MAEHLRTLVDAIFSEWKEAKAGQYTDTTPFIAGFRRNLQRMTLKDWPTSCRNRSAVRKTPGRWPACTCRRSMPQIKAILKKSDVQLDDYTRAHLLDSQKRIHQILNAQLQLQAWIDPFMNIRQTGSA